MKSLFKSVFITLAFASVAFADSSSISALTGLGFSPELSRYLVITGIIRKNNTWESFANATPAATALPVLKLNASNNVEVNAISGKVVNLEIAGTPVAKVTGSDIAFPLAGGQSRFNAAPVITPSTSYPTPNAGDTLSERRTILAAGAPTAAFVELPLSTANVGKSFTIYNQGSNPLAIVPQGGTDVINVSAALTPFSCTTLKKCDCDATISGSWACAQY